jgi:GrpB-like predicted nucleotidyltransferase (UPF0157 family)
VQTLPVPDPIVIVPYQTSWPDQFQQLRDRLNETLGPLAERIEHVGSTSVPGLWAKPIIDLDIVVSSTSGFESVRRRLDEQGYDYLGDQGVPGREAFALRDREPTTPEHHLYVCRADSVELQRHLAFRDYLRTHPERTAKYCALKRDLAVKFRNDRIAYTDAKGEFITSALREASGTS